MASSIRKIALILSAIVFIVSGCGNRQAKATSNELIGKQDSILKEQSLNTFIPLHRRIIEFGEDCRKIEVNYAQNKELLNIIFLLPDSAFTYWDWKIEDRKELYNEIKLNDFWITKNTSIFNQCYFRPNTACFQIIDGSWTISIYKTFDNSFIVITNDIVGDGNYVNIFEVKNNEIINSLSFESLFGYYIEQIKHSNLPQECNKKLIDVWFEHYFWLFRFDFSDENIVEIDCSWLITKDEFEDCLKGNSILYKFNPKTKKFEIDEIYWKP